MLYILHLLNGTYRRKTLMSFVTMAASASKKSKKGFAMGPAALAAAPKTIAQKSTPRNRRNNKFNVARLKCASSGIAKIQRSSPGGFKGEALPTL